MLTKSEGQKPWALYGLAGNPPHAGHWACVRHLVSQGSRVLVAPSFSHAFGKSMAPFETRMRWLRMAAPDFEIESPDVVIWGEEREVAQEKAEGARIYSIDMLRRAQRQLQAPVSLAVGPDNADPRIFSRFYEHEAIEAEHGVIVLPETMGIRSTLIRQKVQGLLKADDELISWVGRSIAQEVVEWFQADAKLAARPALRSP